MDLSQEELDGLSEAEIAALEDDDNDTQQKEGGEDDAPDAEPKDEETKPLPPAAPQPFLPKVDPLAVTDARLAMEKAERRLETGEISAQDYDRARRNYDKAVIKSEFVHEINSSYRNSEWERNQTSFFENNPQYLENRTLQRIFVNKVNEMLKTPEGQKMSDAALLKAAKDRIEGDLRNVHAGVVDEEDPGDVTPQDDNALFSQIDRLTGQAFQDAIDQLSPEQLERYEERS